MLLEKPDMACTFIAASWICDEGKPLNPCCFKSSANTTTDYCCQWCDTVQAEHPLRKQ